MEEKTIKYIITAQHPDSWDEGVFEDHSFENKDEAMSFFVENYINSEEDSLWGENWYLVCVEVTNPADAIDPESYAESFCENLEISENTSEAYYDVAKKHFELMKSELISLGWTQYDLHPNYKEAIIMEHQNE